MSEALNMRLETVRTVLKNEVNEISVCIDLKRRSGVFYTVIAITDSRVRREVAGLLAQGLFSANSDFIGSYTQGESLNLVFLYRQENTLARQESFYATSFQRRRKIAENLVVALAETQVTGSVGLLLLEDRNINIASDLGVFFNYFLDFKTWDASRDEGWFYRAASRAAFKVLAREYELRHEGQVDHYPGELQAFYKKTELNGFSSYSAILSMVKLLPDNPMEPRAGVRKLAGDAKSLGGWLRIHSMAIFVGALVIATVIFAAYQIALRMSYRSAAEKNTTYAGVEIIGDVHLGDETV